MYRMLNDCKIKVNHIIYLELTSFRNFRYLSFITKPLSSNIITHQRGNGFFASSHWLKSTFQLTGQQLSSSRRPVGEKM